ncbi:MAG: hypothetical protein JJ863_19845 [Deltaproteobacteria bacterium]|nr:hypothetical protein [Deltaproteobacteria bacterium]
MARWVVLGSILLVAIVVSCSDDEMPPYATDLGRDGTVPPGGTDAPSTDAGVSDGSVDGDVVDGGGVVTCATVVAGGGVNELAFDDASIAFAPLSAYATYRADCVSPGRVLVVLTESATCGSGERQVVVDLPSTAAVGQTLVLSGGDDVGVTFDDSDGTRFSNLGDCGVSAGSLRIEAHDTTEAGLEQEVVLELAQLYDCSVGARAPITISGTIRAPLDAVFADACPDS